MSTAELPVDAFVERLSFDLRTFHHQALDLGSVGLDPLLASLARL